MKKIVLLGIILITTIAIGYFATKRYHSLSQATDNSASKIKVVTSFYPLYFFASEIGGSFAKVTNITPLGVEPHEFEPTLREIATIEQSQMLIINGEGFETWAEKITTNLQKKSTRVVVAGQGFEQNDPHVWLSPVLAQKQVEQILKGYIQIDPQHRQEYERNAQSLISKLNQLDQAFRQGLRSCQQHQFITSHTAFGYLASEYNLQQLAIAGLSPDAEPSSAQLAQIATVAQQNNVKYIFFETLVSPQLAQTIAAEVGAQTLVLNPLEGLTQNEVESGENYFSLMRENLDALRVALHCT